MACSDVQPRQPTFVRTSGDIQHSVRVPVEKRLLHLTRSSDDLVDIAFALLPTEYELPIYLHNNRFFHDAHVAMVKEAEKNGTPPQWVVDPLDLHPRLTRIAQIKDEMLCEYVCKTVPVEMIGTIKGHTAFVELFAKPIRALKSQLSFNTWHFLLENSVDSPSKVKLQLLQEVKVDSDGAHGTTDYYNASIMYKCDIVHALAKRYPSITIRTPEKIIDLCVKAGEARMALRQVSNALVSGQL